MTTQLARSAIWYAKHGWHIFPLRPRTKEPFKDLGVYHATNDLDQVIDWWQEYPHANIGLHCGASGILLFDLDTYKDTFGGANLLTPEDQETVTSLTGGGGNHLLYAMPEEVKYSNHTGNLPKGIEVRGWGGYGVLAPSIHPNGNAYRWAIGYGVHEIEPLPIPPHLRKVLDEAKAHQRIIGTPNLEAVVNALEFAQVVLDDLGIAYTEPTAYEGEGCKLLLPDCPFNPPDSPHKRDLAAFVVIAQDGIIGAGCHHARCREILHGAKVGGWKWLVREWQAQHA